MVDVAFVSKLKRLNQLEHTFHGHAFRDFAGLGDTVGKACWSQKLRGGTADLLLPRRKSTLRPPLLQGSTNQRLYSLWQGLPKEMDSFTVLLIIP